MKKKPTQYIYFGIFSITCLVVKWDCLLYGSSSGKSNECFIMMTCEGHQHVFFFSSAAISSDVLLLITRDAEF